MTDDQTARVEWRDGATPVSTQFDDPYFSIQDGLGETRHVFLTGNDLPRRFAPDFQIAELGFGTGLNLFTSLAEWRATGQTGQLRFTSFEAFVMSAADMEQALRAFPEMHSIAQPFLDAWRSGARRYETEDVLAEVIVGDARQTLPDWTAKADAWFLDGFAPARNPELWEDSLLQAVASHTKPGGTFATYTAAGHVRRSLEETGFAVSRIPGYGRKRHMSVGHLVTSK